MNICFSGGGINCVSFIGIIDEINKKIEYTNINFLSGTSGGSIIAALFSLGATPEQMKEFFIEGIKLFKNIGENDIKNYNGFIFNFGPFLMSWLSKIIKKLGYPEDLKLSDWPKDCKRVIIHSFCVEDAYEISWDTDNPPEQLELRQALYCSCAIPFIFRSLEINGKHYVDGGLSSNIHAYPSSLICIIEKESGDYEYNEDDIFNSVLILLDSVFKNNIIKTIENVECNLMKIKIPNTFGALSFINIDIETSKINELIKIGKMTAKSFLQNKNTLFSENSNSKKKNFGVYSLR